MAVRYLIDVRVGAEWVRPMAVWVLIIALRFSPALRTGIS
tara:strand:+ start:1777 stop:1896 length:120 start_codon:yes stop_codon:yes gene_type:complete